MIQITNSGLLFGNRGLPKGDSRGLPQGKSIMGSGGGLKKGNPFPDWIQEMVDEVHYLQIAIPPEPFKFAYPWVPVAQPTPTPTPTHTPTPTPQPQPQPQPQPTPMELNNVSETLEDDHKNQLDAMLNQSTNSIQIKDNAILLLQNQLLQANNESQSNNLKANQLISSMGFAGNQLQQQVAQQGQLINSMGQAGFQLESKLNDQQVRYQQLGQFTQHVLNMGKSMEQFYSNILQTNQAEYNSALNSIQHELFETKQLKWDQMNKQQQLLIENLQKQTAPDKPLLLTNESTTIVNHNALEAIANDLQNIRDTGRDNLNNHQKEMLRTLFNMYKQFSTPQITGKPSLAITNKKGDHEKPEQQEEKDKKRGKTPIRKLIPTGSRR
jgi:hypothetical protein